MDPIFQHQLLQTRRQFFGHTGLRLGGLALANLMGTSTQAATGTRIQPTLPGFPHFKPKAKSLIYVHMSGGPSQLDQC